MKDAYIAFWTHNGNVAALWHIGAAVMVIGCVVMIFWGDKRDRYLDAQREYPENTDRYDY